MTFETSRRGLLIGLIGAAVAGKAFIMPQAALAKPELTLAKPELIIAPDLGRYQHVVTEQLAIIGMMVKHNTGNIDIHVVQDRTHALIGYMLDNFHFNPADPVNGMLIYAVFNRKLNLNVLSVDGLQKVANAVIPVAVVKNLFRNYQVTVDMKNEQAVRFFDTYGVYALGVPSWPKGVPVPESIRNLTYGEAVDKMLIEEGLIE